MESCNICQICLLLRLNENDNTGAKYLLMEIYVCFEEEKPSLLLYKKYKEESLQTLFLLMTLITN